MTGTAIARAIYGTWKKVERKIMSPFDASAALLIGFVFGVAITALIADAYYEHKIDREIRKLIAEE
jgi:hypothetical protein